MSIQVAKGILYETLNEVNIMDTQSGNVLLSSSIESGGPQRIKRVLPFPSTTRNGKLYVFATREGMVKELDKQTGAVKSINNAKIELGGKEFPKSIDAQDDGIILCSDQNIIKVGYDGLLKFNRYFTAPRETTLMRALALAEASKGAVVGVALLAQGALLADAASKAPDDATKTLAGTGTAILGAMAMTSFAYSGKALADFNRRFKATTATDDFLIVLSEVAPREYRLLQVNKNSGDIMTSIDLGKDSNPIYQLDLMSNQVYYVSKNTEITCYKMQ